MLRTGSAPPRCDADPYFRTWNQSCQRSDGRNESGGGKSDEDGHIDMADLKAKAEQYKNELAGLMVTYPSTHGVFEEGIKEICQIDS